MQARELTVIPHLCENYGRDLAAEMGAISSVTDEVRLCRNALLLSLREAISLNNKKIRYSRDRNRYSQARSSLPYYWTYRNVMTAVNDLTKPRPILIEDRITPQAPYSTHFRSVQSTLAPGPVFDFATLAVVQTHCADSSVRIILRDALGRDKPIPTHFAPTSTIEFFSRYDRALAQVNLTLTDPEISWLDSRIGYISSPHLVRIDISRRKLVRIFSRDMSSGGRFYRAFWLEIPKRIRKTIQIDGMPTVEHDFSACHLKLAYQGAGVDILDQFGHSDLYSLTDFDASWRQIIKLAINIMFNSTSIKGAHRALTKELLQDHRVNCADLAHSIITSIKQHHKPLKQFWHTGCGIALQYIESEIIRRAIEKLLNMGILALPVHDSLIVASQHKNVLIDTMQSTFSVHGPDLAQSRFPGVRRSPLIKNVSGFCVTDLTDGRGSRDEGRGIAISATESGGPVRDGSSTSSPNSDPQISSNRRSVLSSAKRMALGSLPRIVSVDDAKPWLGTLASRSSWYAQTNELERQVLALKALMLSGNSAKVRIVQGRIAEVKAIRMLAGNLLLPVDNLLKQLEDEIDSWLNA